MYFELGISRINLKQTAFIYLARRTASVCKCLWSRSDPSSVALATLTTFADEDDDVSPEGVVTCDAPEIPTG